MTPTTRRNWLSFVALIFAISGYVIFQQPWSSSSVTSSTPPKPRSFVAGKKNTVLLLTNSEHGLRNVVLATANSLLTRYPEIDLHIASFDKLEVRVQELQQYSQQQSPSASITFHKLPGLSFGDRILSDHTMLEATTAPGFFGVMKLTSMISMFFMPWTGPEYLDIHDAIVQVLDKVDPAVIAVDPALGPGVDAVKITNRNWVVLSANTVRENAPGEQGLAMLWKFPVFGSGYPYPLPWYLIPPNVFLNLRMGYKAFTAPHITERAAWLSAHGLNVTALPPAAACSDAPLCIVHSLAEGELPYHVPSRIKTVGPMVLSMASAAEQDAELVQWLTRAPTVIINMGSIFTWDSAYIVEMALALKQVLKDTNVQVLWKLQKRPDLSQDEVTAALAPVAKAIEEDRVRVSAWIKADPTALMETGDVVLAVHHGGASSFYEPLSVGIPQLLLPQWVDCYDNAVRAEYLNVGIWGHKHSAPSLNAAELTSAYMTLLGNGTISDDIRRKAREIGEICQRRPGRDWAADELAALASGER